MWWQRMIRGLVSVALGSLLVSSIPASVYAATGKPVHFNFDVTISESWCDFPSLLGHHQGVEDVWVTTSAIGVPLFKFVGNDTHTITNPATGKSVIWFDAGQETDLSAVWLTSDTYRVTTFFDGSAERLTLPDGTHLSADVGRVVFYNDFSDNGTPGDFSDDYPIDPGGITFEAGPHPDGNADGAVLCSILDTYLR